MLERHDFSYWRKQLRLDQWLVKNFNIATRSKAQDLIRSGKVGLQTEEGPVAITKTGYEVRSGDEVVLLDEDLLQYVSRGGNKLAGALDQVGLDPKGLSCLDVGQSTGGFTDCLLQRGAKIVYGFDVGHGQLHDSLSSDERVVAVEGLHVKDIKSNPQIMRGAPFDLMVMDVSFISIDKCFPFVAPFVRSAGHALCLVKPQYNQPELGLDKLKNSVMNLLSDMNYTVESFFATDLRGKDGFQEYFVYAIKS